MKEVIRNIDGKKIDYEIEYEEVAGIKFHNVGRVIGKRIKIILHKRT